MTVNKAAYYRPQYRPNKDVRANDESAASARHDRVPPFKAEGNERLAVQDGE